MKFAILVALLAIVAALASAGVFMLRQRRPDDASPADGRDRRMARALAWRVGLSVALFVLILLAYAAGWVQPTGVPLSR